MSGVRKYQLRVPRPVLAAEEDPISPKLKMVLDTYRSLDKTKTEDAIFMGYVAVRSMESEKLIGKQYNTQKYIKQKLVEMLQSEHPEKVAGKFVSEVKHYLGGNKKTRSRYNEFLVLTFDNCFEIDHSYDDIIKKVCVAAKHLHATPVKEEEYKDYSRLANALADEIYIG